MDDYRSANFRTVCACADTINYAILYAETGCGTAGWVVDARLHAARPVAIGACTIAVIFSFAFQRRIILTQSQA